MLHFSRDDESSHKLGSNSDHFSDITDGGGRGHWINAIGQQLRSVVDAASKDCAV